MHYKDGSLFGGHDHPPIYIISMESANVLESPGEKKNENVPALLVDSPKTIQKNGEKIVFSRRKC